MPVCLWVKVLGQGCLHRAPHQVCSLLCPLLGYLVSSSHHWRQNRLEKAWYVGSLSPRSVSTVIVLPLIGILSFEDVAVNYLNFTNFWRLIMAIAEEHGGLQTRLVGALQGRLMLSFMLTTIFFSIFNSLAFILWRNNHKKTISIDYQAWAWA